MVELSVRGLFVTVELIFSLSRCFLKLLSSCLTWNLKLKTVGKMHTKYERMEADRGSKAGITKKTMIHKPVAWVSSTARLCLKISYYLNK